ncbi:MAG: 2-oxoglutarate dehydrogenase E1 component [Hyphomicrobiales bacterium]
MRRLSSPLAAASPDYLEGLQALFRSDPGAVDPGWRAVFRLMDELSASESPSNGAARRQEPDRGRMLEAYRSHGHLLAALDPLAPPDAVGGAAAAAARRLRDALLARACDGAPSKPLPAEEELHRLYAGTLALETAHIDDPAVRDWLVDAFESLAPVPPPEQRRLALDLLIAAEEFERFLAVKWPTKKRFGAEGAETLIPLVARIIDEAAARGVTDIVVAPMHRGRLSLMGNVFGEPLVDLLAKFKGVHPFPLDGSVAADMPYHLGIETTVATPSGPVAIAVAPNPSHLEAVNPVALGRVRARQEARGADGRGRVLGLVLHTDASVIAQGCVAELIQLAGLAGFTTGGTIHVVVNNRIGFTTEEHEARTSRYCTGAWKAVDSAILHVNAGDPDAALRAATLAVAFRQTQGRDAVIDLVCFRRNGHNEIDEPRFTQPLLYRAIDATPPVRTLYEERLAAAGLATASSAAEFAEKCRSKLQESYAAAADHRPNHGGFADGPWAARFAARHEVEEPQTGVGKDRLLALLSRLSSIPAGSTIGPKLARLVQGRAASAHEGVPWAMAEALAFATLLTQGVPVRISGQDVVRGAFSHRHLALADIETGERHVSLAHLSPDQAPFTVINSPLSEYAVLGFEYGYSLERPDALTIWEAQFGDFANGAQIIIDQFIAAGEEKWLQPSSLVLLLPHGLEGQGPEHSSARPERILQLAAKDNIEVANPSTPANYFHLLRRQVLRRRRKPLFVTAPKTLLRLPAARSPLSAFGPPHQFEPVLASEPSGPVTRRVLVSTGKLAYDLEKERAASRADDTAVLRLEMLYPLPSRELLAQFRKWQGARFLWVQEEPENMGAWSYLDRKLERLLAEAGVAARRLDCIARPESPSPAGGFHADHDKDQQALVKRAFA